MKQYLAIDLGATSGRTMIGTLDNGRVSLEELTRFDNPLIPMGGHLYWDLYGLYREIIHALKVVAQRHIPIVSIGIDTWGCDFALFGADGALLRNPLAYRDPHTQGMMENFFKEKMSKEEVYKRTGIQFMNFNSIFQIYAMEAHKDAALSAAAKILFIPDALGYLLTGKAVCEYSVASTAQLLNPMTGDLDEDLLKALGISRDKFGKMTEPGTILGTLTPALQELTGLKAIPVITVAGHDTASAVAAVPAKDEHFAYLSSGTWSLMGIETPHAIINAKSLERNFTNEGGIEGTTRFLKNICGMWIYECCRLHRPEVDAGCHPHLLRDARPTRAGDSCTDLPLHLRLACPALQDHLLVASGVCTVPDRHAPHHRRRLCQRSTRPAHGRCSRHPCPRRTTRSYSPRKHHAASQSQWRSQRPMGNAKSYCQQH